MKPLIGVVADRYDNTPHPVHRVQQKYLAALAGGANALVAILPAALHETPWPNETDITHMLSRLDGLFLSGATSNIAPAQYGVTLENPNSPADPARDEVTLALIRAAVAQGLPTLGVCRGLQEINVALGGTLHQALHSTPGYQDHREDSTQNIAGQYAPTHPVEFVPGGLLNQFTGMAGTEVNSLHGQGIRQLAPPLLADAYAPDGLIEAVRLASPASFLLGVQWHPEWNYRDDAVSTVIFNAFGTAARAHQRAKQAA